VNAHRLLIGREQIMCPEEKMGEKMGPGKKWGLSPFFLIPFFAKFVPQSYNRAEKTTGGSHEADFRLFILAADISYRFIPPL